MNKNFTAEESYQKNNSEKEEVNNKLLELLDSPWGLIKKGEEFGVTGVKRLVTIVFLFALTNIVLFFYSMYELFSTEFAFSKVLFVLLVLIIGIGATIYAGYKAYQFLILDALRVIYENSSSFFQKLCSSIVDKAESLFKSRVDLKDSQLTKALDFAKIVNEQYSRFPKFLRKGIILILSRIPFVDMLIEFKDDILTGNKVAVSTKLYNKMNGFISDSIFGNNNTKWVRWLLPLNIIVVLILIKLKIG